jgi:hypothetical protein
VEEAESSPLAPDTDDLDAFEKAILQQVIVKGFAKAAIER